MDLTLLAYRYKISVEAVRRILHSKWEPVSREIVERQERNKKERKESIISSLHPAIPSNSANASTNIQPRKSLPSKRTILQDRYIKRRPMKMMNIY